MQAGLMREMKLNPMMTTTKDEDDKGKEGKDKDDR